MAEEVKKVNNNGAKRGRPKKGVIINAADRLSVRQMEVIEMMASFENAGKPLNQTQIGKLTGVPQSYISKWLQNKWFKEELANQIEYAAIIKDMKIDLDDPATDTALTKIDLIVIGCKLEGMRIKDISEQLKLPVNKVKEIQQKPEFGKEYDRRKSIKQDLRRLLCQDVADINLSKLKEMAGSDEMSAKDRIELQKVLANILGDKQEAAQVMFEVQNVEVNNISYGRAMPAVEGGTVNIDAEFVQ